MHLLMLWQRVTKHLLMTFRKHSLNSSSTPLSQRALQSQRKCSMTAILIAQRQWHVTLYLVTREPVQNSLPTHLLPRVLHSQSDPARLLLTRQLVTDLHSFQRATSQLRLPLLPRVTYLTTLSAQTLICLSDLLTSEETSRTIQDRLWDIPLIQSLSPVTATLLKKQSRESSAPSWL